MDARALPARPNLEQYKKQAKDLVKACRSGDSAALWRLNKLLSKSDKPDPSSPPEAEPALTEAQFAIAREHGFESWPKFARHIEELTRANSPVSKFELAADAIIAGDVVTLSRILRDDPELLRARSSRAHGAPLLHYIAANGVEDFRQKTPTNAVTVAKMLLDAGAEVDAASDAYDGKATALGLVATSIHPWRAGVQMPLLQTLLDAGASVDGVAEGWTPLVAALRNGRGEAAAFLASRGARLDLEGAAGVGSLDAVMEFFTPYGALRAHANIAQMESGFLWACEYGRKDVVDFLLRQGMDLSANGKTGLTGLHWAVVGGQLETIKLLLERGAPLEATNAYGGTALGQALWSAMNGDRKTDYVPIVETLLKAGAKVDAADYPTGNDRFDQLLRRYGAKPPETDVHVEAPGTSSDVAEGLVQRALQARREARFDDAQRDLLDAVSRLREQGTRSGLARALRELGELERRLPDSEAAVQHYEEAIALLRELDEPLRLAHTIRHLGDVHHHAGRAEQAEPCYQEALTLYRNSDQTRPLDLANAIRSLAVLKGEADEIKEAMALWREAHDLYVAVDVQAGVAESAARLALLAWRRGDKPHSREWLSAASVAADASEDPSSVRYVDQVRAMIAG